MAPDPVKQRAGRQGGLAAGRKRQAHLSEVEREVVRELKRQVRSYQANEHGSQDAVAAWLRELAVKLSPRGDV